MMLLGGDKLLENKLLTLDGLETLVRLELVLVKLLDGLLDVEDEDDGDDGDDGLLELVLLSLLLELDEEELELLLLEEELELLLDGGKWCRNSSGQN